MLHRARNIASNEPGSMNTVLRHSRISELPFRLRPRCPVRTSERQKPKMRRRLRQLLTLQLAAMSLISAQPAIAAREFSRARTVLVLGDSLSEGFRLNPRDAWPTVVAQRLREIDPRYQLVNASVSGSTSGGGLRRLSAYLNRSIDIFIVELGINDAFRGTSVE